MQPLSFRKNFSWTFVGNIVFGGTKWLMLIIIAKLGSPEMVGQLALGVAISMPVLTFTDLQLRPIMVTDTQGNFQFRDYLGLRILTTSLAVLIILIIILSTSYHIETCIVILFVSLERAAFSISFVYYGLFQQYSRMDLISISMMIRSIFSLIVMTVLIYFTDSILWGSVGLAVSSIGVLNLYDISNATKFKEVIRNKSLITSRERGGYLDILKPRWDRKKIIALVKLGFPLGIVMLLSSLNTNIPRYFIESFFGNRELGIFSAIDAPTAAGATLVGALGQAASRPLAEYYAEGKKSRFSIFLGKLLAIGAFLGVSGIMIVWIAGKEILTLLYRPEYAEQPEIFLWLMVATGIHYVTTFLAYAVTSARYFKIPLIIFISVTISSAISCWLLIERYKLIGISVAVIISNIVGLIGYLIVILYAIHNIEKNKYDIK
jgi:O-antigen/teichoic acid export membrane protein